MTAKDKVKAAALKDPEIICAKDKAGETLGSDAKYLEEILGIGKSDLIRLERLGLAVKARYETKQGHRIRWLIFSEALV